MLAYSDTGDGPSLVLLHGLGGDRSRWEPLVDRLAPHHRCVAIDLPGHGESGDEGCDSLSAAAAVHQVVRHLGLASPTIVGHSLGATIALIYGAVYGPRSVVALDPVGLYLPDLAATLAPLADRLRGDDFDAAFAEWEADLLAPVPEDRRAGLQAGIRPRAEVVRSYWARCSTPPTPRPPRPGSPPRSPASPAPPSCCWPIRRASATPPCSPSWPRPPWRCTRAAPTSSTSSIPSATPGGSRTGWQGSLRCRVAKGSSSSPGDRHAG
ncbi:MAG: alpha/beta fold hydrolase [Acidimicrobiales bacterium]